MLSVQVLKVKDNYIWCKEQWLGVMVITNLTELN